MENIQKNNFVCKSNALIESKYKLSLNAQKILSILISTVDSIEDDRFKETNLRVSDLIKVLDIDKSNFYKEIDKITDELLKSIVKIPMPNSKRCLKFQWCNRCILNYGTGIISLRLHEDIQPYLLNLKEYFTKYRISNVLKLNSKYAIRLYEYMKQNEFKKEFTITLEQLKHNLCCENYNRWIHLKDFVIEVALKEINDKTDLKISYEPIKEIRKIICVKFKIEKNIRNNIQEFNVINTNELNYSDNENSNIKLKCKINSNNIQCKYKISENTINNLSEKYGIENVKKVIVSMNLKQEKIKAPVSYLKKSLEENKKNESLTIVKEPKKWNESQGSQKTLNFTNYSQREYDYDSLEKQLLGWDD